MGTFLYDGEAYLHAAWAKKKGDLCCQDFSQNPENLVSLMEQSGGIHICVNMFYDAIDC